jgi:hypothetical protein
MAQHSEAVTPALQNAICTWYTRSWAPYNVSIKLLADFPPHYPEPVHIFFGKEATPEEVLAREDHVPWDARDRSARTMLLVVRRWGVGKVNETVVGYTWYL